MDTKLSPAEFLAQLKQRNSEAADAGDSATPVSQPVTVCPVPNANPVTSQPGLAPPMAQPAPPAVAPPEAPSAGQLDDVLGQLDILSADDPGEDDEAFFPQQPKTLADTGIPGESIERLLLKYLLQVGGSSGRDLCRQVKLPLPVVDPMLRQLKQDQLLAITGAAEAGDYVYSLTEAARDRARRFVEECTYFGAAPVPLSAYVQAVAAQTMNGQKANETALRHAFEDLILNKKMLEKLGPAVNSGRGCFLFGQPGNGKTSIAERVTASFGQNIWIPRCIAIDGDIIRLFDPQVHEEVPLSRNTSLLDKTDVDQRWVRIKRPTVIAGGELTMAELEITQNPATKICEAPLQLKSNCGTLVIDDFGRQRMPVDELLNRWIVPLEKRYDFLNLPSGKKVQVPFDQLIIFSTNLEPKDLVDGAFLRRIPYKIEVPDPSEDEFRQLFKVMCKVSGFEYKPDVLDYLIDQHYKVNNLPFRSCQPRDLLLQVRNLCTYREQPIELTTEAIDRAVENYFSVMG